MYKKIKVKPINDDKLIYVASAIYTGEYIYYPLTFLEECTFKVLD